MHGHRSDSVTKQGQRYALQAHAGTAQQQLQGKLFVLGTTRKRWYVASYVHDLPGVLT